jgi:predicted ester cyclase
VERRYSSKGVTNTIQKGTKHMSTDGCRFEDGKIVEHWGVPDRFALLAQLGLLPQSAG